MSKFDQFLRGRTITLSETERERLERATTQVRQLPARNTLVERGETLRQSTLLVSGFMVRFIDDLKGSRQVVAFHVPGDFVDLHGFPLHTLDHSIATLSDVTICSIPHAKLEEIVREDPDLGRKLWYATLLDAAIHREWLFRLGRLDAVGRVAHFLIETEARLRAVDLSDGRRFTLPLTQTELAEITGLTHIHVNRVLRTLREENVCTFRSAVVDIVDRGRLAAIAQFDPTYLYLSSSDRREGPPHDER